MSNSSNLLISGSGMENPNIPKAWKYAIIGAIFWFVLFLLLSVHFSRLSDKASPVTRNIPYLGHSMVVSGDRDVAANLSIVAKGMLLFGIFVILSDLHLGQLLVKRVKTTEIRVYEDKIAGTAVGKDFDLAKMIYLGMGWANAKLTNFDLALNQITSVDIVEDAIVINASGAQYMCFVSNNSEIQTIVNNKIRNKDNQQGGSL